ncbi:MAG: hypothetical protein ABEK59_12740 [Halobacteria archaeon]
MPSLADAYQKRVGEVDNEERLYLGFAILTVGVIMIFLGGLIGVSSSIAGVLGATNPTAQWGLGAIVGGLGVPTSLIGIFSVIPTSRTNEEIAAVGIVLGFLGVLTFNFAYPHMWHGDPTNLTWLVFLIYGSGIIIDFWALFRSILSIEVTMPNNEMSLEYVNEEGETREIELDEKPTRTERYAGTQFESHDAEIMSGTSSETHQQEITNEQVEVETDDKPGKRGENFTGDRYCGNCAFYDYVKTKDGNKPYCAFHGNELRDLEACSEYEVKASEDDERQVRI